MFKNHSEIIIHFVHRHYCFLQQSVFYQFFLHSKTNIWNKCATAVNLVLKYAAAYEVKLSGMHLQVFMADSVLLCQCS